MSVQIPDDEQFKNHLKRFHPIAPKPIPTRRIAAASWRSFAPVAWLAAPAAIVTVGTLILYTPANRVVVRDVTIDVASAEQHPPSDPLTLRTANAWLANAPSFKAALDDLAFRSKGNPIPAGKQSAVAVLSKEPVKP
jgi:hypothetical protein